MAGPGGARRPTTQATSAVEAMPGLISRDGAGACTTALSQARQPYFGRTVRSARRIAGTTSSASCTHSPMRCIWPVQ